MKPDHETAADILDEVIAAPPRDGKLPPIDAFTNIRRKHTALLEQFARASGNREQAIQRLIRTDTKLREIRKALARSTKRLIEARKTGEEL